MIAYKLFRTLKNGEISPLFINKKLRIPLNTWMEAECHPTKGFAVRQFWHCTSEPIAPHLSMKGRAWYEIEMENYTEYQRPTNQGGLWFLASRIKVVRKL
jgi:murein tripeptide amidase MpaA